MERAVIINVATEVVTSLAIASAQRYLDMPLLVVNCTADGVSKRLMDALRDEWKFDLIDLPLAAHGITLDHLFRELPVERLTLLDSDAEIRSHETLKRMRGSFDDDSVYGAGFIHKTSWLEEANALLRYNGTAIPTLYAERPWIPFATFRTSYVRSAIASGVSFRDRYAIADNHEFVVDPSVRAQTQPGITYADTGAEIHSWLLSHKYRFAGPDVMDAANEISHYHGVTRKALIPESGNGMPLDHIENEVLAKLRNEYANIWDGFASAVKYAQG